MSQCHRPPEINPFDCWVCGHPVLEGQKSKSSTGDSKTEPRYEHLNPADHLPTKIQ